MVLTAIGVIGVVLTAGYMLRMVQRMFLGQFNAEKWGGLTEINTRELLIVAPLALLTILFGVYPAPLSNIMEATLQNLVNLMAR